MKRMVRDPIAVPVSAIIRRCTTKRFNAEDIASVGRGLQVAVLPEN